MLRFIGERYKVRPQCFITREEIMIFNLVKVLLENGYVIEKDSLDCILVLSGI